MWSLIGSLASSATGLLVLLGIVAGIAAGGAYEMHRIDEGKLASIELGYQTASNAAIAKAAAEQKAIDAAGEAAAAADLAQQKAIAASLQQELSNVPTHVKVIKGPGNCITWGLVRVLDAVVLGADPAGLALPAGATDATCSTIDAVALAKNIVANYGTAKLNAQELTDLQAYVKSLAAIQKGASK